MRNFWRCAALAAVLVGVSVAHSAEDDGGRTERWCFRAHGFNGNLPPPYCDVVSKVQGEELTRKNCIVRCDALYLVPDGIIYPPRISRVKGTSE